jgi:hypothetical protein
VELIAVAINALVVAIVGLLVAWMGKGRFDAIEDRIARLETRLDALRSDLTRVALAVGARPRAENA